MHAQAAPIISNVKSPVDLLPGDLLLRRLDKCEHIILHHYGCYAGRDKHGNHLVFEHRKGKRPSLVKFHEFALHYDVQREQVLNIDRQAAINRMQTLLSNPIEYRELLSNCEHAARYIAEGKNYSWQARSGFTFLALCGLLLLLSRE